MPTGCHGDERRSRRPNRCGRAGRHMRPDCRICAQGLDVPPEGAKDTKVWGASTRQRVRRSSVLTTRDLSAGNDGNKYLKHSWRDEKRDHHLTGSKEHRRSPPMTTLIPQTLVLNRVCVSVFPLDSFYISGAVKAAALGSHNFNSQPITFTRRQNINHLFCLLECKSFKKPPTYCEIKSLACLYIIYL